MIRAQHDIANITDYKVKKHWGKLPSQSIVGVLISLFQATEPVGGYTTESVTHGEWNARCTVIFPAIELSDRYQIILLGDRHTWVNDLPRIIIWKWNRRESNLRPVDCKCNTLTITTITINTSQHVLGQMWSVFHKRPAAYPAFVWRTTMGSSNLEEQFQELCNLTVAARKVDDDDVTTQKHNNNSYLLAEGLQ